jgi:glucosylceramidase
MKPTIIATILLISFLAGPSQGASGPSKNHVEIYLRAKDTGQRLAKSEEIGFDDKLSLTEKEQDIVVDPSKTFQTVLGIGGALTDASAGTSINFPRTNSRKF